MRTQRRSGSLRGLGLTPTPHRRVFEVLQLGMSELTLRTDDELLDIDDQLNLFVLAVRGEMARRAEAA